MRRLIVLLAALWVAFALPAQASNVRPIVRVNAGTPAGYTLVYSKDYARNGEMTFRQDGPSEETMPNGSGSLQDSTIFGRTGCIGQAGQGANFWVNRGLCNPGGGYAANGQFSQTNGAFNITMEPTPASISASLPLTYQDFSATCSNTSFVMTCGAPGSGTITAWATLQGTGVPASCHITSYGSGTGGAGTYGTDCANWGSTTVTTTKAFAFVSGWVSTRQSFGFKPDKGFCLEVVANNPSVHGTWGNWWTQSNQAGQLFDWVANAYGTVAQAEVDLEHFNAAGPTDYSSNFHWAATAGGAYNSSNTNTTTPSQFEGNFHTFRACGDLQQIQWWYDGVLIATAPVSATSPGWGGNYQYLINSLDAGNSTAAFEGVYTGGTSVYSTKSVKVWLKGVPVAGVDYFNTETGDGKGRELMFQSLLNPRFPTSGFSNGVTTTSTTTVDSIPGQPVKIAVNNATFGSAQMYFGASPVSAVVSGHVYTITAKFAYVGANPSGSAYIGIGHSSANDTAYTMTGTTPTLNAGSGCTGATITTVGSHKEFTCQFTAPGSGDMFMQFGPLSNVNTQDVSLYALSYQDNAPNN